MQLQGNKLILFIPFEYLNSFERQFNPGENMFARVVVALLIALSSTTSLAKDDQKKLSDEDRKALDKVNLVVVMRNNQRASVTTHADGKAVATIKDQNASFRVNIDAIKSTYWTVQYADDGGQGVQVDRQQVMTSIFEKDVTEELKSRITRELRKMGIYPIKFEGNSVVDNSPYAAEAQVLLKIDLDLPVGEIFRRELQSKNLQTIVEIPAAPIYEQVVLGIKPPVADTTKVTITNTHKESVVGLLSLDKRDKQYGFIVKDRDDMIVKPGQAIYLKFPPDACDPNIIALVVFADATYAESPMSELCTAGAFPDLKTAERYPITGHRTQQDLVTIFYSLHTLKFQKTEGSFDNHRLTGKGWTNFHGDVHVSEFKDGYRHGTGNFCARSNGGTVQVYMNEYDKGAPRTGYTIILEPNKVNKDPTNGFAPISFEKLYKKLCFWDY